MSRPPFHIHRGGFRFDRDALRRLIVPIACGALALLLLVGLFTSFHTVAPEGRSVVKRFGAVVDIRGPGLHFKLPFGIDRVTFVPTERQLTEEFGFRTVSTNGRTQYEKRPPHRDESLMLSGDLKVIDVEWVVQYRVRDADRYLHQVADPDKSVRDISEAVMRRIVGNELGSGVLTRRRTFVAEQAEQELQKIFDAFDMGVVVHRVEMQDVTPPERVKPAFNEVNQAEQERERLINEAERQRSQIIPRAQGEARQTIEEAEAYATQRLNRARGEAARFSAIYNEYAKAPAVTRQRLYLEMIDDVLPNIGHVYVVEDGRSTPLPLLNLNRDATRATPATGSGDRN